MSCNVTHAFPSLARIKHKYDREKYSLRKSVAHKSLYHQTCMHKLEAAPWTSSCSVGPCNNVSQYLLRTIEEDTALHAIIDKLILDDLEEQGVLNPDADGSP
jgi:hypothetical protein